MKFSCIMTTFNDGDLIRQSIASVLRQSYEDFELLLVDDGSAAPTRDILAGIADPRLRLLPQANDGVSSARNRGLHHAKGEYICFLDGDDTRSPWSFAEAAQEIEATRPDLILVPGVLSSGRTKLVPFMDQNCLAGIMQEEITDGSLSLAARKAWASSFEPQPANKFISRKVIERGAIRFPNDHFFEDILFHVLVVAHAESIVFLGSPGFTYFQRQLRQQTTTSNGQIRFDILGTTRVMFQLFEQHSDFHNIRQRGAVSISALRLLRWCEQELPRYHRDGFRRALRELLRGVDPRYLVIDRTTPDPRGEREHLVTYALEVMA